MRRKARKLRRSLNRAWRILVEGLVWGGPLREGVLLKLLGGLYQSRFRRQWSLASEPPHFTDHRITWFRVGLARGLFAIGPSSICRAFFSSEVVRPGDRVLDIGCGDGFFTTRFLADMAEHVDGLDMEPSAIAAAQKQPHAAPNVSFHLLDAVAAPFPGSDYDVIVWDGALGHFAEETTHTMLKKIRAALGDQGIFVGSETLGREGYDHLQFFESLDDLRRMFIPYFDHVHLRFLEYPVKSISETFTRREAYWRCSNDDKRLKEIGWNSVRRETERRQDSSHG